MEDFNNAKSTRPTVRTECHIDCDLLAEAEEGNLFLCFGKFDIE